MKFLNALLRYTNLPGVFMAIRWRRAFGFALLVGVVLAIVSAALGVAVLGTSLRLGAQGHTTTVSFGYMQSLNYGPWYVFFAPFCFLLASLFHRPFGGQERYLDTMAPRRQVVLHALGVALLAFFVWKNVVAEVRDYRGLALGWVQAEFIDESADRLRTHSEVHLDGRRFSLPSEGGKVFSSTDVAITEVNPPDPQVTGGAPLIVFVAVVKTWVAIWEATMAFCALVALCWCFRFLETLRTYGPRNKAQLAQAIREASPRTNCLFLLGIAINLFMAARFITNAQKGSFGTWDQYASMLILSPGLVAAAAGIFAGIVLFRRDHWKALLQVAPVTLFLVWATSLAGFLIMLLRYHDAPVCNMVLALIKVFIEPFK